MAPGETSHWFRGGLLSCFVGWALRVCVVPEIEREIDRGRDKTLSMDSGLCLPFVVPLQGFIFFLLELIGRKNDFQQPLFGATWYAYAVGLEQAELLSCPVKTRAGGEKITEYLGE